MKEYKSFNLLNDLYFVRTGGSADELKAANILLNKALELGADEAHLEEFDVDGYEVKKASLKFNNPDIEVTCAGVGQSGSTSDEGISGKFLYVPTLDVAKVSDLKNKIVMVSSKLVRPDLYKYLIEHGVKGLILCTGSVYKEDKDVDLDPYMYRERCYKFGKIPAVCVRMKDAEKILRLNPKKVNLTLVEDELTNKSHNVVATIKGSKYKDEIVCFTAHYDSVSFSKGAYDNATGSTAIMQILSFFAKNAPLRTLKFVWCGSEEMGLLGSKAYVLAHEEELKNYKLNINIDMLGVTIGYDLACCSADNDLVNFINYEGKINGFAINSYQGVYSSDSTPFADKNVPAVSFARLSFQGGAIIHSHDDVMDYLSEPNYYASCNFIIECAKRLVNSVCFPVNNIIPSNVREDLDKYLGIKK